MFLKRSSKGSQRTSKGPQVLKWSSDPQKVLKSSEKYNTEETTNSEDSTTKEEKAEGDQMEVDDGIDCEGSDGDDETDDVTNMELSWEMFELTSVICKRQLS